MTLFPTTEDRSAISRDLNRLAFSIKRLAAEDETRFADRDYEAIMAISSRVLMWPWVGHEVWEA